MYVCSILQLHRPMLQYELLFGNSGGDGGCSIITPFLSEDLRLQTDVLAMNSHELRV